MPILLPAAENAIEVSRSLLKAARELDLAGGISSASHEVLTSWEMAGSKLDSILRTTGPFEGKLWTQDQWVNRGAHKDLDAGQDLIFSATPGSEWAKIGNNFELYKGNFLVGGDLKATAYGGKVSARDQSEITARGNVIISASERSNIKAHEDAIVRVGYGREAPWSHKGTIALYDRSNMIDLEGSQRGAFHDMRADRSAPGYTSIPIGTPEFPYMNSWRQLPQDSDVASAYKHTLQATFGIERKFGGHPTLHGTSFLVSERKLATAGHIFRGSFNNADLSPVRVMSSTGKFYDAHVYDKDWSHDLALLELKEPLSELVTPLRIGDSALVKPGDGVMMVGRSGEQRLALGHPGTFLEYQRNSDVYPGNLISSLKFGEDPNRWLAMTSTNGHPGTSGGPLVSLKNNEALGVVRGGFRHGEEPNNPRSGDAKWTAVYTPSNDLINLLNRNGR